MKALDEDHNKLPFGSMKSRSTTRLVYCGPPIGLPRRPIVLNRPKANTSYEKFLAWGLNPEPHISPDVVLILNTRTSDCKHNQFPPYSQNWVKGLQEKHTYNVTLLK